MKNNNLTKLENQAAENATHNNWGEDAYTINTAILEIDPKNCAAYTRLAKYYKLNENFAEAESMYLKTLGVDPENRTAINNLYEIQIDREESTVVGNINTMKELLKEAQKAMLKSKYNLAAKLYMKAYSIEPLLTYAIELANVYKKMGKQDKIEMLYKQLIKDNPKKEDIKAIEKEFKMLRMV